MKRIYQCMKETLSNGKGIVLVTIIREYGSSPRGAGAQMIVGECGRISGTIGGGNMEYLAEQKAISLLRENQGGTENYVLRKAPIDNTGAVCGGDVTVLFSYCDADSASIAFADAVLRCLHNMETSYLVLPLSGYLPMIQSSYPVHADDKKAFVLPVQAPERAILFGAGHIAAALAPLLKSLSFQVVVYDDRPEYVNNLRFPSADSLIAASFGEIGSYLEIDGNDFCIVATSGHEHDLECEAFLLRQQTAYTGVVGSRKKIAYVNSKLKEMGISEEAIRSVHTPIGLSIKAVTPEEIAVSIASEMILERALKRERKSGHIIHPNEPVTKSRQFSG